MNKIFICDLPTVVVKNQVRNMCRIQCPDCKAIRDIRKDSYKISATTLCRSCINLRRPTKPKDELFNIQRYIRTKKGRIYQLYQAQKTKSIERGYSPPTYSQEELYQWAIAQKIYHTLFAAWKESGYKKDLGPSIDRLDDYVSYTLQNIRIVTWKDNNDTFRNNKVSGITNKTNSAVDQFDLNNNFIARYYSQQEAMRQTGVASSRISKVCQGKPILKYVNANGVARYSTPKTAGGFIWKYSTQPNDNAEKC